MLNYVKIQGPKSSGILFDEISGNTECFRFSVAKVNNQNYFIGSEEYVDNNDKGRHHIAIRFSYDLVNWSVREKIIETANEWDAILMNYPILLSADGWSNTAIDLDNFYVIGTHSHSPFTSNVNRINVRLFIPPPPTKKPTPCGVNAFCPTTYRMGTIAFSENNIHGIYPNPNHKNFQFGYTLNENSRTQINIFDITGKLIFTNIATYKMPGYYTENINIRNIPNGVYLLEFLKNDLKTTYKLLSN